MKRSELFFSALLLPMDYIALIISAILAYYIRHLPSVQRIRPVVFNLKFFDFLLLIVFIGLVWIAIYAIAGLYKIKGTKSFYDEFGRIFLATSAGVAFVTLAMVSTRNLFDSRFIILASWFFSIILVSIERACIRYIQRALYQTGIGVHRVILVGNGDLARDLENEFNNKPRLGYKIIASYPIFDEPVKEKIIAMAKNDSFDEIIETDTNMPHTTMLEIVGLAHEYHRDFKYAADLFRTRASNFGIETYADVPIVEIRRTPLIGWGRILKRIFDIIFSAIFIIIMLPIIAVTAIAIKIDSEGPIFFKYKRVGERGRVIDFIKFRTMIKDAHKYRFDKEFLQQQKNLREGTPMMKFENDPRITRVGKFLRKWSIDELPQLFLALAGKMSLVGPRPHEMEEVEKYTRTQKNVLAVKPGITGMAQVSGRSDLDFNDEVRLDTYYIENWSLLLDIKILLKTPGAIFKKRNTL